MQRLLIAHPAEGRKPIPAVRDDGGREVEVRRSGNGGDGRDRTGEWRFCRPLPYHLATSPIGGKFASVVNHPQSVNIRRLTGVTHLGDHAAPSSLTLWCSSVGTAPDC